MVLKYTNSSHNTGNTVRKKLARELCASGSGKGAKISNLRYYSHRPDFEALLSMIEDKIYTDGPCDWLEIWAVKDLLEYFINLNDDISDGLFQRDYIPTTEHDLVEEMVAAMKELCAYESQIQDGTLDLGLGPQNGISITLSVYENGELAKARNQSVYKFDTNRSYHQMCSDFRKEQEVKWERNMVCEKRFAKRGLQRKQNLLSKSALPWEPSDFVYPMSEEISITVVKSEASERLLNALHWSSVLKPYKEPRQGNSKKALKKSAHQKVKNWSYHNNISRKEIQETIDVYYDINNRHLEMTKKRQKLRERKFRRFKRKHPEMVHLSLPEHNIPVGLWPDDVARIKARGNRRLKQAQKEYAASIAKKPKKKAKLKKRGTFDATKRVGDTFLTHVSFVDDYDYVNSKDKKSKVLEDELKVKETPRITRTLEPWEFVDEILYHSEPDMRVMFKDCEVADMGNLTLSPPPPSLKPSLKERRSSKASSEGDDIPTLLGLPFVMEDETKETSELSSQADGAEQKNEEGQVGKRHKKSNKTNGRKRKKLKQKQEALRRARTVSFTENVTEMIGSGKAVSATEKSKVNKDKDGEGPEDRIILSRQVSVHTKDNTWEFVESLSDYKFEGIQLKLKSSNLKPSYLVRHFGNNYQEASTFPRVLNIDVTDKVINVVKLFRKTEEPFCKPIASLVLRPNHGSGQEIESSDDNLRCTMVSLFIKADMEFSSFEDLYLRMKDKLKYSLIYPLTNVVEDFVQIYRLLPYTSYLQPQIIPAPLPKADERIRSQLDWLYALCQWKFDIYPAQEAYALFQRSFQVTNIARPTTSRLCRLINDTPNLALRSCDMPTCYNTPMIQLLSCQHVMCSKCIQHNVLRDLSKKEVPFTCWMPGCKTTLDPVCVQYMLSLPLYKLQQVYLEDLRIQTHPLWQWCPKQGCGRVVKLSGAGFLDNGVVIMCDCGTIWCFHCRREGHWPASCEQAKNYLDLRERDYKDFKESKNLISGSCPVTRVLCMHCSKPNFERSDPLLAIESTKLRNTGRLQQYPDGQNREEDTSGLDSGFGSEESSLACNRCECIYEVCRKCVQTVDSAISVPQVMLEGDEGISPSSSQSVLLPLLYYHSALMHHQEKKLWSWASVEIRTGKILQQLRKSKARIASSSPTSMRSLFNDGRTTASKSVTPFSHHGGFRENIPSRGSVMTGGLNNTLISEKTLVHLPKKMSVSNRPRTSHMNLSHTMETEKFFLVLVQQFIQQSHVLLEYVYVYLMEPQSAKKTPEVIPLVISLEGIIKQIQQLLSSMNFSSSSVLTKLHKLHDAGNKLVVTITTTFKNTNVNSLASRNTTFCKSSYNKLPPIGHKYTKVTFAEPRTDRNPTFI